MPSPSCSGSTEQTYARVTEEVTRLIAAAALAEEGFPKADQMPRLAPVPHNHLGHNVLLDYKTLSSILWGTVKEIQKTIKDHPANVLAPIVALLVAGGLLAVTFLAVPKDIRVYGVIVSVIVGLALYHALLPDAEQIIADVRARNMKLLLEGKLPPSAETFRETMTGDTAEWGDGKLDGERCPVLVIMEDDKPFPGYGRHQARQLFVCRPEDGKPLLTLTREALDSSVREALIQMAENSGIDCVTSGRVVLIDGRSLHKTSPWLKWRRGQEAPPMFLDASKLHTVPETDPGASVRVYTCVQAVVPEYLMCVTFFMRTFLAGNSAICEVNVSTLGPPAGSWNYVRNRLSLYERQKKKTAGQARQDQQQMKNVSGLGMRLLQIRLYQEHTTETFKLGAGKVPHSGILKLDPFDKEQIEQEQREIKRIAENQEMWAGYFTEMLNWREWNSITFTTDFFGNTESRAALQTLYDRISRSALSRLKECGYDISDYKDESGKFSLNAEKIEQLVVGERVYMESKPDKGKDADKSKEADKSGGPS